MNKMFLAVALENGNAKVSHGSGEIVSVALTRQFQEHPGEDAFLAPPLPTTLERLVRAISFGRITPSQAIAIDEYNPG